MDDRNGMHARIDALLREVSVTFVLGPDALRSWHPLIRSWVIDAATFEVWVGGDARYRSVRPSR